jgi:hypothetical protein
MRMTRTYGIVLLGTGLVIGFLISHAAVRFESSAKAAGGKVESPTAVAPDRYVYYRDPADSLRYGYAQRSPKPGGHLFPRRAW